MNTNLAAGIKVRYKFFRKFFKPFISKNEIDEIRNIALIYSFSKNFKIAIAIWSGEDHIWVKYVAKSISLCASVDIKVTICPTPWEFLDLALRTKAFL